MNIYIYHDDTSASMEARNTIHRIENECHYVCETHLKRHELQCHLSVSFSCALISFKDDLVGTVVLFGLQHRMYTFIDIYRVCAHVQ